uniref:Mannose binding lectin 2 n=1 Tax=Aquila chrysaetos chrysaetos TaxID=223781 RepID=A0A663F1K7_AQUCH
SDLFSHLPFVLLCSCISTLENDIPEEKVYSCPVIQCSAPAVNGLPGRDGRDAPKGEKQEPGTELRTFSNIVFFILLIIPLVLFHASFILSFRLFTSLLFFYPIVLLQAPHNVRKLKMLSNIKSIGKKIFVSTEKEDTFYNGKSFCAKAGSALASPRKEAENTTLKDLITPSTQAYMGISAEQTKSTFMYPNEEAVTYRNWNAGEPNNLKNEDCAVMQDSGKWNDVDC